VRILVLNVGSSSLKFQLVETDGDAIAGHRDRRLARGQIERIGGEAICTLAREGQPAATTTAAIRDQDIAVTHLINWLTTSQNGEGPVLERVGDIEAVGHRVVHGGERFTASTLVTEEVQHHIEALIDLAPLHNPHNLRGIQAARAVLGAGVPQVAVFDTAFHQTLPERAFLYAVPYQLYRRYRVRRYGFHGTSHRYVADRYREITGRPREKTRIVTLHLGNGASACAIVAGSSTDTSMGFTPLEGLVMGTRSGDVDPAVLDFVATKEGYDLREMDLLLNKQSGLLGISGLTSDMRELLAEERESGDRRAALAIEIFCYRIKKYLGAYLATMNGADAIVFAGGIGEHSAIVRARICADLDWLGIRVDDSANGRLDGMEGRFDGEGSRLELWVIPTDEELLIARDTWCVVTGATLG
jgi:acetate kinase